MTCRSKPQVVKAALVEEQSKARKPLQDLAPLFPDLGELNTVRVIQRACFKLQVQML